MPKRDSACRLFDPLKVDPMTFRYLSTVVCNVSAHVASPGVVRMRDAYRQLFSRGSASEVVVEMRRLKKCFIHKKLCRAYAAVSKRWVKRDLFFAIVFCNR